MFSIMIVEDDKIIAESLKEALEKWQYQVHIATDFNDIGLEYEQIEETVLTDRKWLQVLIEQILSNSLKYTPNGTIKILYGDTDQTCDRRYRSWYPKRRFTENL